MGCRKVQPLHICNFLNTRYFITSGHIGIPYLCCSFIWEEGGMEGGGGGGEERALVVTPNNQCKFLSKFAVKLVG